MIQSKVKSAPLPLTNNLKIVSTDGCTYFPSLNTGTSSGQPLARVECFLCCHLMVTLNKAQGKGLVDLAIKHFLCALLCAGNSHFKRVLF